MRNLNCVLLSMLFLFVPMAALAGDLDSPARHSGVSPAGPGEQRPGQAQ